VLGSLLYLWDDFLRRMEPDQLPRPSSFMDLFLPPALPTRPGLVTAIYLCLRVWVERTLLGQLVLILRLVFRSIPAPSILSGVYPLRGPPDPEGHGPPITEERQRPDPFAPSPECPSGVLVVSSQFLLPRLGRSGEARQPEASSGAFSSRSPRSGRDCVLLLNAPLSAGRRAPHFFTIPKLWVFFCQRCSAHHLRSDSQMASSSFPQIFSFFSFSRPVNDACLMAPGC